MKKHIIAKPNSFFNIKNNKYVQQKSFQTSVIFVIHYVQCFYAE